MITYIGMLEETFAWGAMPAVWKLLAIAVAAAVLMPILIFVLRFLAAGVSFARGHRRGPFASPLAAAVLERRVGMFDCDVNMHVTNARYLALVDTARFDLLGRLGFFPLLVRDGFRTLIGTTCIRFRRELPLFARYRLRSRLLGWDEKWIYGEHHFELGGRAAVVVLAKFLVIDGDRRQLDAREALRRMAGGGDVADSPELPDRVVTLLRDSDALMSPD